MKKTLIFDFDGTIADSFETMLGIFEEISARPQKLTAKEIVDLRGKSLRQVIKYLEIKRWQIPRLILNAKRLIAQRITGIKTFPGMADSLRSLHNDGHQMLILSTNGSANIKKFLTINNLNDCFSKVYGDIGLRSKASALKRIIKKEKLHRADCVYIGDEVRDVEAAKKAGVMSAGVGWGFNLPGAIKKAKPSVYAAKPHDLTKILK